MRLKLLFLIMFLLCFGAVESAGICPISTIPEEINDSFFLRWDPSNPETINRNQTIDLTVSAKCPDYTWTVTGNGFWFDANHTITELVTAQNTVTLYADGSSCGAAWVEVTDTCFVTLVGQIRSSTGVWRKCPEPDTGNVKRSNMPPRQHKSWIKGKFQWYNWTVRCCENQEDHEQNGCEWYQCLGQGLPKTTMCADDDPFTVDCERGFGRCWNGNAERVPGHMYYWDCP